MKQVNDELDKQRRQEKSQTEKQKNSSRKAEVLSGLNQSKYVLLKNLESLTEKQQVKLVEVRKVSPILAQMYQLKEEFCGIFQQEVDWLTSLFNLGEWLKVSAPYFPQSRQTIRRWLDEILA